MKKTKEKNGLNISVQSFITAIVVIFVLMILTYGLTFVIPGGEYARIIDESGKIKNPPQQHNELASNLYYGWLRGLDDIVGPAVLAALRPTGPYNELDWYPLNTEELLKLEKLGYNIPEKEEIRQKG